MEKKRVPKIWLKSEFLQLSHFKAFETLKTQREDLAEILRERYDTDLRAENYPVLISRRTSQVLGFQFGKSGWFRSMLFYSAETVRKLLSLDCVDMRNMRRLFDFLVEAFSELVNLLELDWPASKGMTIVFHGVDIVRFPALK